MRTTVVPLASPRRDIARYEDDLIEVTGIRELSCEVAAADHPHVPVAARRHDLVPMLGDAA